MTRDGSEGSSHQVVLSLLDGLLHQVVEDRNEEVMIVEGAEDESLSRLKSATEGLLKSGPSLISSILHFRKK